MTIDKDAIRRSSIRPEYAPIACANITWRTWIAFTALSLLIGCAVSVVAYAAVSAL